MDTFILLMWLVLLFATVFGISRWAGKSLENAQKERDLSRPAAYLDKYLDAIGQQCFERTAQYGNNAKARMKAMAELQNAILAELDKQKPHLAMALRMRMHVQAAEAVERGSIFSEAEAAEIQRQIDYAKQVFSKQHPANSDTDSDPSAA